MKKLKEIKAYQNKNGGPHAEKIEKKRQRENWEYAEKPSYSTADISPLKDIGSLDQIQNSTSLQMEVYQTGDLVKFRYFLEHRRCFQRSVQRQMTRDCNLAALDIFLEFREFEPDERKFMIARATCSAENLDFLTHYLERKSLGKQWEDVAKNGSLPLAFIKRFWDKMPSEYQKICNSIRHIFE